MFLLKWTALFQDHSASLNVQAVQISPEKLKPKAIASMVQDWIDDYDGPILASGVDEYAEKIYEVCHGHAGLTGACCQSLKMEAEAALNKQGHYSLTAFDDFLTQSMTDILSGTPIYSRLLEEIQSELNPAQLAYLSQVESQCNGLIVHQMAMGKQRIYESHCCRVRRGSGETWFDLDNAACNADTTWNFHYSGCQCQFL